MLKLREAREELVGYFSFSQFSHFLHIPISCLQDLQLIFLITR